MEGVKGRIRAVQPIKQRLLIMKLMIPTEILSLCFSSFWLTEQRVIPLGALDKPRKNAPLNPEKNPIPPGLSH
jgi:hypothetical protein